MNVQEFKIWFSGFNAAMGTNTPNISQWNNLRKMVDELDSPKDYFKNIPLPVLPEAPKQTHNPPGFIHRGINREIQYPGTKPTDPF